MGKAERNRQEVALHSALPREYLTAGRAQRNALCEPLLQDVLGNPARLPAVTEKKTALKNSNFATRTLLTAEKQHFLVLWSRVSFLLEKFSTKFEMGYGGLFRGL